MPTNDKRRQKKLERRNSQRKERRRTLVKSKNQGLAERLASAANAPVLDCLVTEEIWDEGMGQALFSRQLPNGDVAFALFLVDTYCLGVKNAFGDVTSRATYRRFLEELEDTFELVELTPANLRSLVEGAIEFARDLGFEPHADYRRVKPILGDIDAAEATERFQFGDDTGKPHFVAGPRDDPQRCYQILSILEHACGADGFHYTMPLLGAMPTSLGRAVRLVSYEADGDMDDDIEDDDED